jgi:hypothetical protein
VELDARSGSPSRRFDVASKAGAFLFSHAVDEHVPPL